MSLSAKVHVSRGTFELFVDLEVADGEVVAVLGPNGSGKTTLVRTLAGLESIGSGLVSIDGVGVDDPARRIFVPPERRRCAVVFQDYALFSHMSVLHNVAFGPRSRGATKLESKRRAHEWLERVGLAGRGEDRTDQLSGGEAQRVALARALASDPRLVLLDEPMAALDVSARASVRSELRRHLSSFDGPSIIVTHDPLDAAAVADRLVIIENGLVVQHGTLREVTSRPRTPYVAELMGVNLVRGHMDATILITLDGATLQTTSERQGDVFAVIAPRDVALYTSAPGGSPRNAWPSRVANIHHLGGRVRVLLDAPLRIAAEITEGAIDEFALVEGSPVWASVKATQIDVYEAGVPDAVEESRTPLVE